MSKFLEYIFKPVNSAEYRKNYEPGKELEIATAALLIQAANADDDFSEEEKSLLMSMISSQFNLDEDETRDIMKLAEDKIKQSVSFYEFTSVLNSELDADSKYEILKNIWRLLFADKILHSHEEYFIRKISQNLHLEHKDFITAKSEIKRELNL